MILITGSKGLLGREVVKLFQKNGNSIFPISKKDFDLVSEDLLKLKFVPDAIIHLAAAVPTSIDTDDSLISAEITRKIDNNVCNAAKMWNCKLLYASTCAVYKRTKNLISEESELDLESPSPYIQAKISGEKLANSIPGSIICRLPALVGDNMNSKSILLTFINNVMKKRKIELWGTGKREQNFLDVLDVAKAFDLILKNDTDKKIYNIANSKTISMIDLANMIISVLEKGEISFADIEDPNEDICVNYDVNLAEKALKWSALKPISETIRGIIKNQC